VLARVRSRRSARCADGSHDPWIGLDREEPLPKLLPLRGRGTGGVEPGGPPAVGQEFAVLRPVESERSNFAADSLGRGEQAWRVLRKMRFEGPPSRFDELVDAACGAGLELDDYAIDTTGAYGWPMCGNGLAVVIVVVDDDEWAPKEIAAALRAAHERTMGSSGDWITSAGSFVYLPDGLEPEWYDDAGRLAEALHAAERAGDVGRTRALRKEVARLVAAALPQGESNFARLRDLAQGLEDPDEE